MIALGLPAIYFCRKSDFEIENEEQKNTSLYNSDSEDLSKVKYYILLIIENLPICIFFLCTDLLKLKNNEVTKGPLQIKHMPRIL